MHGLKRPINSTRIVQLDVKLVWACQLVGCLDEEGSASSRASNTLSRQGPDPTKPAVQGFGNASVKLATALSQDVQLRATIQRFVLLRRQGDTDVFDRSVASQPPQRTEVRVKQARERAKAEFEAELAKKEKEGLTAPGQGVLLPWEKHQKKK